jgi:hypothetical protein
MYKRRKKEETEGGMIGRTQKQFKICKQAVMEKVYFT